MSNRLKTFIRIDHKGRVVPGSVVFRINRPRVGSWKEIYNDYCCGSSTTTSTTSTTTTTTTTATP